jgi:hypothetical protein
MSLFQLLTNEEMLSKKFRGRLKFLFLPAHSNKQQQNNFSGLKDAVNHHKKAFCQTA